MQKSNVFSEAAGPNQGCFVTKVKMHGNSYCIFNRKYIISNWNCMQQKKWKQDFATRLLKTKILTVHRTMFDLIGNVYYDQLLCTSMHKEMNSHIWKKIKTYSKCSITNTVVISQKRACLQYRKHLIYDIFFTFYLPGWGIQSFLIIPVIEQKQLCIKLNPVTVNIFFSVFYRLSDKHLRRKHHQCEQATAKSWNVDLTPFLDGLRQSKVK